MSPPKNHAAYTDAAGTPIRVGPSSYTEPDADEVLIEARAVAVNPVDWAQAQKGLLINSYPYILGCDVSGTVTSVGSNVTKVQPGDRVLAQVSVTENNRNENGAYQEYVLAPQLRVARIPDRITFEEASVLPLAVSTAGSGLYPKKDLALPWPSLSPKKSGKTLLVWGGSSSVGCCAIQFAVASGADVVATCSPRNFELCRRLGATAVFDHAAEDVAQAIMTELGKGQCAGAFVAIANPEIITKVGQVLHKLGGGFISTVLPPDDTKLPEGVTSKWMEAGAWPKQDPEGAKAVWEDFLPKALESGQFVPAPEAEVVGKGLETVDRALEAWKKGVSAKKIVVSL